MCRRLSNLKQNCTECVQDSAAVVLLSPAIFEHNRARERVVVFLAVQPRDMPQTEPHFQHPCTPIPTITWKNRTTHSQSSVPNTGSCLNFISCFGCCLWLVLQGEKFMHPDFSRGPWPSACEHSRTLSKPLDPLSIFLAQHRASAVHNSPRADTLGSARERSSTRGRKEERRNPHCLRLRQGESRVEAEALPRAPAKRRREA
jgi:hypothetical protein